MKSRYIVRLVRKPMRLWTPGVDVVDEIVRVYAGLLEPSDILVLSDKALSVAYGYIYNEELVSINTVDLLYTRLARFLWTRVFREFIGSNTASVLEKTPLRDLARHKKLVLRLGFKYLFKPVSEAGVDTTNLPYTYVSIPMDRACIVADEIRRELLYRLGVDVNILVVDSDKCFKPRFLDNIAFSTRPSFVKGVVDLGVIAYVIGRAYPSLFKAYPTPVAYSGEWIGLKALLKIARHADRVRGCGVGRNVYEVLERLGKRDYREVSWSDLSRFTHYPVVVARIHKL